MKRLLIVGFALVLCGCSIFPKGPDIQISTFDLGVPHADLNFGKCSLEAGDFQGKMPSRQKMIFRSGTNRLMADEFNRWSDVPPEMLKSFLDRAFAAKPADTGARKLLVEGDIFQFEGNLDKMTADLEVELKVFELPGKKPVLKKIYKESVAFEGKDASLFAAAMSSAAKKIAESLASDIAKAAP